MKASEKNRVIWCLDQILATATKEANVLGLEGSDRDEHTYGKIANMSQTALKLLRGNAPTIKPRKLD